MQERIVPARPLGALSVRGWLTRDRLRAGARQGMRLVRSWLLSDVVSIFVATRLVFLLLTYFGRALFHDPALVGPDRVSFSGYLLESWFYRDSQWFLTIVNDGYSYFGPGQRSAVAFFPVYPMVVKALHGLTGLDAGISAMVVANISFLAALVYLYKLCLREFGEAAARRSVFYMAIFPTAFFFFAPYSESMFVCFSLASLYYARGERWWLAGLFGGLAAATRILGVLLVVPFIWEYLRRRRWDPRRFRLDLLAGLLIPGGLGAYMLYLYGLTGDALAFVRAEAGWNRVAMWPWQVLSTSLRDIPKAGDHHPYFQAHAIFENSLVLCCLVVLLLGLRRVPFSFVLYGLCYVALQLSAPVVTSDIPITSMSRYLLVVVPIYIILARLGRWPIFDRLYTLVSLCSLAIFTTLFLNHMWGA